MKHPASLFWILLFTTVPSYAQTLPTDESGTIKYLLGKEVSIRKATEGHAVRLMSSGKPAPGTVEYQLSGLPRAKRR